MGGGTSGAECIFADKYFSLNRQTTRKQTLNLKRVKLAAVEYGYEYGGGGGFLFRKIFGRGFLSFCIFLFVSTSYLLVGKLGATPIYNDQNTGENSNMALLSLFYLYSTRTLTSSCKENRNLVQGF